MLKDGATFIKNQVFWQKNAIWSKLSIKQLLIKCLFENNKIYFNLIGHYLILAKLWIRHKSFFIC